MKKYTLILSLIILAACQTPPDYDDLSSEFIVSTSLDKQAEFNSYNTFYISDTIVNLGGEDEDTIWHDDDASQLVAAVKQNMANRGYTYVQRHQNPDIAFVMGIVKVLNVEYYPGWWGGYPGWWDPWYGWGYYPYYPWTTVYAYETGTIIIDAYDVLNAEEQGQLRAVWNSTNFGALGSTESSNINRGVNSINQSFQQSPYFNAN